MDETKDHMTPSPVICHTNANLNPGTLVAGWVEVQASLWPRTALPTSGTFEARTCCAATTTTSTSSSAVGMPQRTKRIVELLPLRHIRASFRTRRLIVESRDRQLMCATWVFKPSRIGSFGSFSPFPSWQVSSIFRIDVQYRTEFAVT